MATIKSYSDLEQSKKLAEILPLESADMYYAGHQSIINPKEWEYRAIPNIMSKYISFDDKRIFYPCWSLSALLSVIPGGQVNRMANSDKWEASSWNDSDFEPQMSVEGYDNPIDACYEVIIKLYELKML